MCFQVRLLRHIARGLFSAIIADAGAVAERPKVDPETFPHTPIKVRQSVLEKVTRIYVQFFPRDLPRACKDALAEETSIYEEATGESSYRNGSAHRMIALKRRLRATLASRARAPAAETK
jgi:hypothetical protein